MPIARPSFTRSPLQQPRLPRLPLPALGLALTWVVPLAAFHATAQADPNPYYIGGTVGVAHDTNVFRRNSAIGDTYYSAGLIGGIDQPISRQRLYGSGIVRYNRYSDLTELNHTSYGLNAALDWSTINKLSGTVSVSANQSLANYGDTNLFSGQTTRRNIEKSNQELARVQYGAASLIVLEGSYTHRDLSYSDPLYESNGLAQNAVSGGVKYQPSAALSIGLGLRYTRGRYEVSDSSFDRRDIDLTTTWIPSGQSIVTARVSFGKQDASDIGSARDFSGTTGYVSWTYQPTGKLRFNTWLSRDTGAETSFFNTTTVAQLGVARGDTSDVTNTVAVDASYAATGKIGVNAALRLAQRSLERGALTGSDRVYTGSLGASYQALRNVALSCNVARETRSTSSALSVSYGSTTFGCTAQATLQ